MSPSRYIFDSFIYWIGFYGLTFAWSLRVTGRENMPRNGPVLLLANHQSFMDPAIIGFPATRYLTYLARSNLWNKKRFAQVIDYFGAIPIDRNFGKEGLNTALAALEHGQAVLVFPEGERTHDGQFHELKAGITLLVKKANCPIVPVGIAGAFHAWPRHQSRPACNWLCLPDQGRALALAFGEPIPSTAYLQRDRADILDDISQRMVATQQQAERIRRDRI